MAFEERPNVDSVLLASRVPYLPNMFVIGPFASRVSFASQQRRALTLSWAIDEDLKRSGDPAGLAGKDVGIIGAGLAGLTCAMAMGALGSEVWLFEKESKPLSEMFKASHRHIHPTINFWPQEKILPTTQLPFLNWYHGQCDDIARRIWGEWGQLKKLVRIRDLLTKCEVSHFDAVEHPVRHSCRWRIRARDPASKAEIDLKGLKKKDEFDVLIFATGFGPERISDLCGTPGYWNGEMDRIGGIAVAPKSPCEHYVISGTGDGGVIETLRLLYRNFKAGGIEPRTCLLLSDDRLAREIRRIESSVQRTVTDWVLHRTFPLTPEDKDEISDILWNGYKEIVSSDLVNEAFDEAIEKSQTKVRRVILLGERTSPLDMGSSPYHKFFLAYAIRRGLVEYYQLDLGGKGRASNPTIAPYSKASLSTDDLKLSRKVVKFKAKRCIKFADGDFQCEDFEGAERNRPRLDNCFYIRRHGTNSPIDFFFKPKGEDLPDDIRKRQSLYADHDWLTLKQANFFARKLRLHPPEELVEWADNYHPQAKAYFNDVYGVNVDVDILSVTKSDRTSQQKDSKIVDVKYKLRPFLPGESPPPRDPLGVYGDLAFLAPPSSFFGVDVDDSDMTISLTILETTDPEGQNA